MRIVIEGQDKIGKTTQVNKLLEMDNDGTIFTTMKFPYEEIYSGRIIRQILNKELPYEPVSFQALMVLNKIEAEPFIEAEEENFPHIVFDRYSQSGYAYGGQEGLDEDWLLSMNQMVPEVNVVIILVGKSFATEDDIYGDAEFQAGVNERYERLYSTEVTKGDNPAYYRVDGNQTIEKVHADIMDIINKEAEKRGY